jgi:RND family efflux transporter MFP subunit
VNIFTKFNNYRHHFWQAFNSTNKEVKYVFYGLFILSFTAGLGIELVPRLMNAHQSNKLVEAISDHPIQKSVSVSSVEVGDIKKTFTIFSSLKGRHEVQLFPDSKVTIHDVLVKPGDFVKQGQILAQLDSYALKIRKRLSDIDFQLKEAEYTVTKNLAEKEFVSKNEMNQKSLEFEAEKLRQELSQSESANYLIAPISGLVTEVKFNSGDYIDDPSKYYLKIVDQTAYRIEAYLPYEIAKQLNVGGLVEITNIQNSNMEEVKLRAPASEQGFFGKIIRISPGLDQSTGTVSVDIEAVLSSKNFQVGSFVESKFILGESQNAIIVKNESILYENDRPFVFRIASSGFGNKNTLAQKVFVGLGINEGSKTAIISGLDKSDSIVYEGQNSLKDNDPVEVFNR